jgi:hypothetical protein
MHEAYKIKRYTVISSVRVLNSYAYSATRNKEE